MTNYTALAMSALIGFVITSVLGFFLIPWLKKLKFGQTILDIGPSWHKSKQGTPTMGGLMFAVGTVASAAIVFLTDKLTNGNLFVSPEPPKTEIMTKVFSGIIMAACFCAIGFADDYISIVKKRNKGLNIKQKTFAQIAVCTGYLCSLYLSMNGEPRMFVPFIGDIKMGWFFWPFGFCVIYAAINAVNFTDGIDGLCSSVTFTCAAALCSVAVLNKLFSVGVMASSLAGGCIGFFVWNKNPAKVFMGDTGSMFLGGMVVAIAYALNCPVILLLFGIIYVIEGLSDVIQIGYFKATGGKRVFKMAPIHHHFEMSGWKEKKIVRVFVTVNVIGCITGLALYIVGG